jgi:hypothetical protein
MYIVDLVRRTDRLRVFGFLSVNVAVSGRLAQAQAAHLRLLRLPVAFNYVHVHTYVKSVYRRVPQQSIVEATQYTWDTRHLCQNVSISWRTQTDGDSSSKGGSKRTLYIGGKESAEGWTVICFHNFDIPICEEVQWFQTHTRVYTSFLYSSRCSPLLVP